LVFREGGQFYAIWEEGLLGDNCRIYNTKIKDLITIRNGKILPISEYSA
jgi:hypothetical protein